MTELSRNANDDTLSIAERLVLVQGIWDSIAAEQDDQVLSESQSAELDSRMTDRLASPEDGKSWEHIKHLLSQK